MFQSNQVLHQDPSKGYIGAVVGSDFGYGAAVSGCLQAKPKFCVFCGIDSQRQFYSIPPKLWTVGLVRDTVGLADSSNNKCEIQAAWKRKGHLTGCANVNPFGEMSNGL